MILVRSFCACSVLYDFLISSFVCAVRSKLVCDLAIGVSLWEFACDGDAIGKPALFVKKYFSLYLTVYIGIYWLYWLVSVFNNDVEVIL